MLIKNFNHLYHINSTEYIIVLILKIDFNINLLKCML